MSNAKNTKKPDIKSRRITDQELDEVQGGGSDCLAGGTTNSQGRMLLLVTDGRPANDSTGR